MPTKFKEAAQSSVHELRELKLEGLPNVFRARNIIVSLFWLILFVSCTITCVILIKDTVNHYTHWSVTTTVRYLTEQEAEFPTVVIYKNLISFWIVYCVVFVPICTHFDVLIKIGSKRQTMLFTFYTYVELLLNNYYNIIKLYILSRYVIWTHSQLTTPLTSWKRLESLSHWLTVNCMLNLRISWVFNF